jgi:xanthosine utilization system XapX-like protein
MKFPKWALFLFPIPAIVVIAMFPILAIVVGLAVAIWAFIAAEKAAATKTQDKPALGENEVQAIAAPDRCRRQDPQTRVHDDDAA